MSSNYQSPQEIVHAGYGPVVAGCLAAGAILIGGWACLVFGIWPAEWQSPRYGVGIASLAGQAVAAGLLVALAFESRLLASLDFAMSRDATPTPDRDGCTSCAAFQRLFEPGERPSLESRRLRVAGLVDDWNSSVGYRFVAYWIVLLTVPVFHAIESALVLRAQVGEPVPLYQSLPGLWISSAECIVLVAWTAFLGGLWQGHISGFQAAWFKRLEPEVAQDFGGEPEFPPDQAGGDPVAAAAAGGALPPALPAAGLAPWDLPPGGPPPIPAQANAEGNGDARPVNDYAERLRRQMEQG